MITAAIFSDFHVLETAFIQSAVFAQLFYESGHKRAWGH